MGDGSLFRRGCLVDQLHRPEIFDRENRHDLCSPDVPRDQRVGHLKEIGARVQDVVDVLALDQQRIAFLHDVVNVESGWRSPARQPSPQRGFMRQNAVDEPASSFGVARGNAHTALCSRSIKHPEPSNRWPSVKWRTMLGGVDDEQVSGARGRWV